MTDTNQPFDRALYDAVMASRPDVFKDHQFRMPYGDGYRDAARTAARIAAERVAVSDEERPLAAKPRRTDVGKRYHNG